VKLLGSEASKASLGACVVLEVCVATGGLKDVVGVNVGFADVWRRVREVVVLAVVFAVAAAAVVRFADVAILGKYCVDVGFDRGWGQGKAAEWIA
jgi:hypothetical protein